MTDTEGGFPTHRQKYLRVHDINRHTTTDLSGFSFRQIHGENFIVCEEDELESVLRRLAELAKESFYGLGVEVFDVTIVDLPGRGDMDDRPAV